MDPAAAKQQIIERIKQASNVLVTVSNNPSVDQLAACIGVTLLFNKMNKHATAVFSGQVPSTIEFLQPEKTIETNTDSLQDFIISLDKDKADKLRYKVENDVVRIFITPYKTSLSEKDLVFSQGDFNVEVVLTLGVKDRAQLDKAITAHGRILHDATVVSVNAGNDKAPELGQINWQDPTASSLCEMLVSISEAFGTGLIDNQMATAFLTGIVAETKRFSNDKTSPKVMTMSAQLMAAGANQQLIVSKLEPPAPPPASSARPVPKKPPPEPQTPPTGVLNVSHKPEKPDSPEIEVKTGEIRIDEKGNIIPAAQTQPTTLPEPVSSPSSVRPAPTSDGPIPGPHSFLDPSSHQPVLDTPFSADTKPNWSEPKDTFTDDPLSNARRENDQSMDRGLSAIDNARDAVQKAAAAAPFDPAAHPIAGLGAQPLSQTLHPTPPPPVPPPLIPPK
ncbi:hypothetical protein HYW36_02105 [Candidatus Saccharibacteria bacterium]|nr:hypothetical protein [Candidatus Saccharibacteria bacterium]